MPPLFSTSLGTRQRILAGFCALVFIVLALLGALAQKGWLPATDPVTGNTFGWFGRPGAKNAPSNWNPFAGPPTATPLPLSKEYIYAGSKLLAVEDANAIPAPPADLAVWRPTTGTWWVMGGLGSQQVSQNWGTTGDKAVPGDYDGDGKTDFSIFRPSTGEWFVLQTSDNAWAPVFAWGNSDDKRVPADYDGDGKTDRAVWRPSDGVWYVVQSSNGTAAYYTLGSSSDVPAPADYDGDGRADVAVWRDSNHTFYSIKSSNLATSVVSISPASGVPVSADYDGDGKADHAVRQGATWIIRKSSDLSIYSMTPTYDLESDVPVQNDYDGDGKVDIAVWRNSNGRWYIRQSASDNSLREVQWGIPEDIPVPAFYRR